MDSDKRTTISDYYREHWHAVVGYIDSRISNRAEAEDMAQELFLKLLSPTRLLSATTLPALVYTMARNAVTDYWRRMACRKPRPLTEEFFSADTTGTIVSYKETSSLYRRCLSRLKEEERRVVRLNVEWGKPVSEISLSLNIGYKQAEYRLGSARRKIREQMLRAMEG